MTIPGLHRVDINALCVNVTDTIRQAVLCIDRGYCGVALVVDAEHHLIGTVTDGDVRRAMLATLPLEDSVARLLAHKANLVGEPVVAPVGTSPQQLLQIMKDRSVRQIPLLDANGRVEDLATLDELSPRAELPVQAVIMAGGFGTRLRPLTENMPKPMLPVNGRPVMEHIIHQLREIGIQHVNVTTHYKSEKIIEHFGDGHGFGVELNYINEDRPLGTGGALGLMSQPTEPLLVINGDIVTEVDFKAMLAFHQDNQAMMTIAARRYEIQVPYGVIECEGSRVQHLSEKPHLGFLVNAGIYLLEPAVFQFIPQGQSFNMTDLIQWLLDADRTVTSFPIHEYWLDIGQHADYAQAQADMKNGKLSE